MSPNLCILPAEFRGLLDMRMCCDPVPAGMDIAAVDRLLDQVSRNYGFADWIVAYREFKA